MDRLPDWRGWIVRRYGLPDDIEATPSEASDYLPQPKCARQTEDIMTHVLIVMSWLGAVNGAMISTQEFTSADTDRVRQGPWP